MTKIHCHINVCINKNECTHNKKEVCSLDDVEFRNMPYDGLKCLNMNKK